MPEENKDALEQAPASAGEGVEETPAAEQSPATPYDDMKSFMEDRNLKSPDDLTGYVDGLGETEQWKKQYGDSQNQVGELRRELEGIRSQIQQNQAYQPEFGEQPAVNIGDVVEQKIVKVLGDMQQQQQKSQMKYMVERNELMKKPGWKDVQEHFDKALTNPEINFALQNGSLTQEKLYYQINDRVMMSRVNSLIDSLPEGAVTKPPPSTDTSDRVTQPPPEDVAKAQRIAKAKDEGNVDALLKELIPDNDSIANI
jgi:hypothetical protein